jgi:photosystem II stability/assembly factor-like uncharacterized protein
MKDASGLPVRILSPKRRVRAGWPAGCAAIGLTVALSMGAVHAAGDSPTPTLVPEARVAPDKLLLLGSARAGKRLVVVGERGRILYTDDNGTTWKISDSPVLTTLTSIAFFDDKNGVAVGHRGTLLVTQDGGASWQEKKVAIKDLNSLLSVWVHGEDAIAVGAYGTYLESHDTGRSWTQRQILGDDFDRHLNAVVAGKDGTLLIAGESGTLAVSSDGGKNWKALKSPYEGTFFGALGLTDRTILVFGMRGTVLRTSDNGAQWSKVDLDHYADAVQNGVELPDGGIVLVGAGGLVAVSRDQGATFAVQQTKDRRHIGSVNYGSNAQLLIAGQGGASWSDLKLPN